MEKVQHDVVVLGGGLMGSSAAWHLSNQGYSVLLVEKQEPRYSSGSSKGEARIVRSSNVENDELWSYLHNSSVREVELLIKYLNAQGIATTIEDIYTTSPVSFIAKLEELDQLLNNLEKQGIDFKLATTPDEGESEFGVRLRNGIFLQREYKTHSGTLNPNMLIQSLHKAILLKGNRIWYSTQVEFVEKKEDVYSILATDINGNSKTIHAKQMVCATGPYTGSLLKNIAPYFDTNISPNRVFLAFFKIKNDHYDSLTEKQKLRLKSGFPVIDRAIDTQSDEFYAMIEKQDSHGHPIIKVGGHYHRSSITNPDDIWKAKLSAEELNWAKQKMVAYLNFLNLPIKPNQIEKADEYSCIYSLTETEVPYVTPILYEDNSKDKNFIVIAGMSGVGAKGAMAYGLIAANLLSNNNPDDPFFKTAVAKLGYERLATKTL